MGLTTQSPISLNHFSKMVISSNNESRKIAGLKWKQQFYYCSSSAQQTNGINVFIINTFVIIQLSTSNKVSSEFDNKNFTVNIIITRRGASGGYYTRPQEQLHKYITYFQ